MTILKKINYIFIPAVLIFVFLHSPISGQVEKQTETDAKIATNPKIRITWLWLGSQLIPSPQWSNRKGEGLAFGLRWQVTPLLYSFGLNKNLNPWRYFISEPLTRQSGSLELYFSPEYSSLENNFKNCWLFRGGIRLYLPIWHKGEYLSISLSSSYYNYNGQNGLSCEGGFYLFAGFIGFQTTYSPTFKNSEWKYTFRIRIF